MAGLRYFQRMSFLKKLFGGGSTEKAKAQSIAHEGYMITPMAMPEGGQFRLCAEISREIDGETKTHMLIRADILPSSEAADEAAIRKAKQVIKEQGDKLFT